MFEHVTVHLDADAGVLRDSHLAIRHPDGAAYEVPAGGVEVSHSSIGSYGFADSGVGGRVAMY